MILVFIRNSKKWYAVLRYANGFGLLDSKIRWKETKP